MIKHEGKEYRNLIEQVAKNKELINYILDEEGTLNQYGIKVIVEVENKAELDSYPTEELEYGDGAISRDNTDPEAEGYAPSVYIWTRANNLSPVAYWAYMGKIRGPQGVVGPQGPQGEKGNTGDDALYWATGSFFDAAHDPYMGYTWNIPENEISNYFSRDELEFGDTYFNLFRNTVTGDVFVTYWAIMGIEGSNAKYASIMKFQSTRGPQGLQGNQGPQGIQGIEGPIGAQGPRGEQGIDGGLYPITVLYPGSLGEVESTNLGIYNVKRVFTLDNPLPVPTPRKKYKILIAHSEFYYELPPLDGQNGNNTGEPFVELSRIKWGSTISRGAVTINDTLDTVTFFGDDNNAVPNVLPRFSFKRFIE